MDDRGNPGRANESEPEKIQVGLELVDPDQLVRVTFYLPASSVPSFQQRAAEWMVEVPAAGDAGGGGYVPPFRRNYGPKNPWDLPAWTSDDLDAAAWLVADLSERQREVVAQLIAAGDAGCWTVDLRRIASYGESARMNGVFKALAGRCRACGRRPFWNGGPKNPGMGQKLSVSGGATIELFRAVLDQAPDL